MKKVVLVLISVLLVNLSLPHVVYAEEVRSNDIESITNQISETQEINELISNDGKITDKGELYFDKMVDLCSDPTDKEIEIENILQERRALKNQYKLSKN